MYIILCITVFFKQFITCLARYMSRNAVTLLSYSQHGVWILENLSSVKCSIGLVCKKHKLFSFLLLFFNAVLPCLHFLKLHIYQFMNYLWDWKSGGGVQRGWGRRAHKKFMLKILGIGDAFNMNVSGSAQG